MQRGMMMQFDKLPLPVYVLRVEADASGLPQDFIFVYANSACASFLGIDGKNYLLGMSFSDIWGDNGAKWLNIYTKTALEGLTQNIEDYNENLKKYLSVDCYQPMYGYCGCFMRDVVFSRLCGMPCGRRASKPGGCKAPRTSRIDRKRLQKKAKGSIMS